MSSRLGARQDLLFVAAAAMIGFVGVFVFSLPDHGANAVSQVFASVGVGCDIKGNVSISSGERIYHVPGQQYYLDTKVDARFGERWFCSEADARAAGWRKSGV